MWYTVVAGALVSLTFIWMLNLRFITHLLLGGLTAFALASMICLTALMDNPFRGELSVSPDAYQLVYDSLMKK